MHSLPTIPSSRSGFHPLARQLALAGLTVAIVAAFMFPLSRAEAAGGEPIGHLDSMVVSRNEVTVTAWAIDRDTPTSPVTIRLYLDGKYHSGHRADRTRNDVARAHPGTGTAHGLSTTIRIDPAHSRELCAYAINTTGSSPHELLGCRVVGTKGSAAPGPRPDRTAPIGRLEAMSVSGSKLTVRGWALDKDTPADRVTIRLYVDGAYHSGHKAGKTRRDVATVYPGTGTRHGFAIRSTLDRARAHDVCAFAINTSGNTPHRLLGCRRFGAKASPRPTPTPPPRPTDRTPPTGSLDSLRRTATGIVVSGWARDPDVSSPIVVRIYVDGKWAAGLTANRARSGAGSGHGFKRTITFDSGGDHRVCAFAIDHNGMASNTGLGCRTVDTPYGPGDKLTVTGRGWGHGYGMGQWGALGYAVLDGWSTNRILGHFYGKTHAGAVGNSQVRVRITRAADKPIAITTGSRRVRIAGLGGSFDAVRFREISGGVMQIEIGPGCLGPWTAIGFPVSVPIVVKPPSAPGDAAGDDLQYCDGSSRRHYRGNFEVSLRNGQTELVNIVRVESYLRSVVPLEVPASWASAGGGKGAAAVRAQAVAARTYAMVESRSSWYKTCDTTSCQVYAGRGTTSGSGVYSASENPLTNAAIRATAGDVRRYDSNGRLAYTQFSASTGGHTIGGVFPGVVDAGDRISSNPHHRWTARIPVSSIESRYGLGRLLSADVVGTDGWGDDGGRATLVRLRFTNGQTTVSGNSFRLAFGLKSSWFRV